MSVVEPGSSQSKLVQRVKDILLRPSPTWEVIETEPTTIADLYKGYVIPLAAIPAVAAFIGMSIIGVGVPGFGFKTALIPTLISQIVQYALTLGMVYVVALIIDGLSPTFGGTKGQLQAFKVVAYSYTAAWVAGIFFLIPMLAPLSLAGLYSFYLLYKGLPRLMKIPEDKAVPFIAVMIIISIVLWLIVMAIVSPMTRMGGPFAANRTPDATVRIGDTSVNLRELEAASKKLEKAAEQMEAAAEGRAGAEAANPDIFKVYLPPQVAGFTRTELSTGSGGIGGVQGSAATAEYQRGDSKMSLVVTDMGAMGALAALGGAFNVESSSESNGKYERVGKVDGRMTLEEYDSSTRHGSYGVMIGDRFMVQAEGDRVTMDELKAAVAAVDAGKLEQLARAGN